MVQLGQPLRPKGPLSQPRRTCIATSWLHAISRHAMVTGNVGDIVACRASLFTAGVQQELQLRWLRQPMSQMGPRAPSQPKAGVGVGAVGNLMQEMFSKTSSAKSPQLLLTSRAGVRQWAQLGRAFWPEGSLAQPQSACIAAAEVRPGAWSHSFKQVVLVRGLDHIPACEEPLFTSVVQQELQPRWLRQPMSQMGARAPSHPCLLYTSPSPRDRQKYRMPSSA